MYPKKSEALDFLLLNMFWNQKTKSNHYMTKLDFNISKYKQYLPILAHFVQYLPFSKHLMSCRGVPLGVISNQNLDFLICKILKIYFLKIMFLTKLCLCKKFINFSGSKTVFGIKIGLTDPECTVRAHSALCR